MAWILPEDGVEIACSHQNDVLHTRQRGEKPRWWLNREALRDWTFCGFASGSGGSTSAPTGVAYR